MPKKNRLPKKQMTKKAINKVQKTPQNLKNAKTTKIHKA